ncbi:MAG TPA: VaFE repeat-containing surface-anchored protein, partial [Lachnospiraceae bacterium]
TSSNSSISDNNSCYSLEGAVYGLYSDAEASQEIGKLITDVNGDSNTINDLSPNTYYVKEIAAPKGFVLDSKIYPVEVKAQETTKLEVKDTPGNDPVSITLNKVDSSTGETVQGGASLAGAEFKISYYAGYYDEKTLPSQATRSWVVATQEKINTITKRPVFRTLLKPEYLVSGDELYFHEGIVTMPLGTITIEEIKAPTGYSLENKYLEVVGGDGTKFTKYITQVTMDNNIPLLKGGNEFSVPNQIIRGDIEGVKVGESTHKRLGNVPFKITSKSTGENHVIVTDKNGQFSTKRVAHSKNTNAGTSYNDGVWFGSDKVDDSLGALPYDTYIVEELKGEGNKGYELIPAFEVTIDENKQVVNLGTLKDEPIVPPTLKTTAVDKATQSHVGAVSSKTIIVDTVAYTNLIPGKEYTLKGTLMVKETKEPLMVDGKEVTAEKTFIPKEKNGKEELEFSFPSTVLEGKTVVAFERVSTDKVEIATHTDINDEDQSVHFPKIGTKASVDGQKEVTTKNEVVLVDEVSYENLISGKEYTLSGILMDKKTNSPLLINGKEVKSQTKFTPNTSSGSVDVTFIFSASELGGKEVVAFESLKSEKVEIATHTDINDEGQTVKIVKQNIKIHTTASASDGGKTIKATKDVTIIDKITHEGKFIIGNKYKLKGILMDKESGKEVLVNGKPVTAEKEFVADKEQMELNLSFTLDASNLKGKSLVVFEELYDVTNVSKEEKVSEHKDINDEGQTVKVENPTTKTLTKEGVKTGDKAPLFLFLSTFAISFGSLAAYVIYKKRNKSVDFIVK